MRWHLKLKIKNLTKHKSYLNLRLVQIIIKIKTTKSTIRLM